MKPCQYCGEQIEESTSKCPFCGSNVEPELTPMQTLPLDYNVQPTPAPALSNQFKVMISMISTIPLLGNLIGIIVAIVYMNKEGDTDKKSFGKSLLIGSLISFLLTGICCVIYFVMSLALAPQLMQELQKMQ